MRKSPRLTIGIVDLIAKKPIDSAYTRLMYASFASIMPQAVAVWAEELGHDVRYLTYTGREDLSRELGEKVDLLFVCAFTQAAYLAYAISSLYRGKGAVTVISQKELEAQYLLADDPSAALAGTPSLRVDDPAGRT